MCCYELSMIYAWIYVCVKVHWHKYEYALYFLENEKVDFSKLILKKKVHFLVLLGLLDSRLLNTLDVMFKR